MRRLKSGVARADGPELFVSRKDTKTRRCRAIREAARHPNAATTAPFMG